MDHTSTGFQVLDALTTVIIKLPSIGLGFVSMASLSLILLQVSNVRFQARI
jgi:hypothetical protein